MKREPGMAYDSKVLNKIFAVVSVLFLFVTIWMVLDDYIRPWKAVQVKALDIEKQKIQEKIKEIDGTIDGNKLKEIKANIALAEKEIESHKVKFEKLNTRIAEIDRKIYVQNMINGVNGSQASEYQFKYEHALIENHPDTAKKIKFKFDDFKSRQSFIRLLLDGKTFRKLMTGVIVMNFRAYQVFLSVFLSFNFCVF